ncbi:MAG: CapA family protein, partial [Clostridia bacterium]|nr:CapA family protein [Clostridia bacterium]
IGHHPHVLQGMECYKGRMIAYSMGNFCFGGNQNPRDKDTMIYRQTFTVKDGKVTDYNDYGVVPCSLSSTSSRNNYQPTPAEGSEKQRIADKIQKFSDKLGNINVKFEGVSAQKSDSETRSEGKTDDSENRSGGNKTIETENSIIL